ncbi:MAG: DUF885 family protein [Caulobacteraceae bacterium]|nr:DUF885 family protein [Caulobacteraceae bacterium]
MLKAASTAIVLALASVAVVQAQPATPPPAAASTEDAAFAALLHDYEVYQRGEDPFTAGSEGDKAALAQMPDFSRAAEIRRGEDMKAFAARLAHINRARLSTDDARLNHAFLTRVLQRSIESVRFDGSRLAFDSEGGPSTFLAYMASSTRISNRQEAEAYLQRLDGVTKVFADVTDSARRGIRTNFTQPRSVVESALAVMRAELAVPLDDDVVLRPFAVLPASIPAAEQAQLRERLRKLAVEKVRPAREAFVRFVETEYLPKARKGLGIGSLPGGQEYYAFLARGYTTTDMTPAEIHALGVSEVNRIRGEMDVVMRQAGWTGDFASFLHFLRTDPQFYATSREDMMEKASEIAKRIDDKLPTLFRNALPRLPYGVRPVPREIEDQYTTGRYNPGSFELGIAGGYMVNTGKLDQRPLYELPALTLHEAVPGHHLQIANQQELTDLPWFRRNADVTAFVEGWGLYSEYLGIEMGIYRNPYERFGKLSYEMWRACRLVADTGIHAMGWSIEQARACFRDNSALAPHNIETELQRYIGWPGQALAYKIGELKLKELRRRAEAELGDRFDVRAFHDFVLRGGPLPLDLLDQRVNGWIAEQKSRP